MIKYTNESKRFAERQVKTVSKVNIPSLTEAIEETKKKATLTSISHPAKHQNTSLMETRDSEGIEAGLQNGTTVQDRERKSEMEGTLSPFNPKIHIEGGLPQPTIIGLSEIVAAKAVEADCSEVQVDEQDLPEVSENILT